MLWIGILFAFLFTFLASSVLARNWLARKGIGQGQRWIRQATGLLLCGLLSFSAVVGMSWSPGGGTALAQSPSLNPSLDLSLNPSLVGLSRVSDVQPTDVQPTVQPTDRTQTEITDSGGTNSGGTNSGGASSEISGENHSSGNPAIQTLAGLPTVSWEQLPPEAQTTINLIYQGGPFPYNRDGIEFQNRERLLPQQPRGYYREYTVETPGATNRGARRIVAGQNGEMYYTEDHYSSFVQVQY